MDGFLGDLRFAVRTLVRAPTFTVVAVATLALGIGANTAIFSVVDGVLLRSLPYEAPEELVTVWLDMSERDGPVREWFTSEDLADYRAEPGLFAELAGWGGFGPTLTGLGEPTVLTAATVTQGMFTGVLGVQPVLGRSFLPEEDLPGGERTVVLSHRFWQDRFAGDPSALGRAVILGEVPFTVIGVMPEGFQPPFVSNAELWRAAQLDPQQCGRGCFTVRAIGRLAEGVSIDLARARGTVLATRLAEAYPDTNLQMGVALFDLQEDIVGPVGRALWVLLGAVGFVLLIACTNVANLLLSRGAARESEFAVRVALGAGRGPIVRQLLTESCVLATMGALLGLALAAWGKDALVGMAPVTLPALDQVGLDGRVLAFAAVVTLGTGIVFGLFPALRASRPDVYAGVRLGGGGLKTAARLRATLVVSQVAMAMVLLVGAGLLIRSFQQLNTAELGFDPEGVLTVSIALPGSRFVDGADRVPYYHTLLDRLEVLPGVISVGATNSLPLAGGDGDADFRIEGQPDPIPPEANVAWVRRIAGGYFYTVGQRLLEGREFNDGDDAAAPEVVIINETLAGLYFEYPQRNPVGSRVAFGAASSPTWRTVVGIAKDTRHFEIRDGTRPAMYFPYQQVPSTAMSMVMRTDGDPMVLASDVRATITGLDASLAASNIAPMSDLVDGALQNDRFVTNLLAVFALLALALAAVGLYGVISYGVQRRMREMGIRLALGAGGDDVQRMVVRGGLGLTAAGIGLGLLGAVAVTGVLEVLLYDVSVTDPLTFAVMAGVLTVVAVVASWMPARKAGSADPVSILREE